MSTDLIRYDLHVQDALRGVVRKVLIDAAREGLPGEHHFYISFRTEFPGVKISSRLREKYPEEMTIVLQHQFWDLLIGEHSFEVGLSFNGIPERLVVPFEAVTGFFDPSVQFGLKFETQGEQAADAPTGDAPMVAAKPARGAASEPAEIAPAAAPAHRKPAKAHEQARGTASTGEDAGGPAGKDGEPKDGEAQNAEPKGAQVVSLDAFRKKQ